MRIGIYLPEIGPAHGGAYTFVETIAGMPDSGDSTTVFHYGAAGELAKQFSDRVDFHCLAEGPVGRFAKRTLGRLSQWLQAPLHLASAALDRKLPYPPGSPLDHAARTRGIDLMLFPTPMFERVDVPYAITIWDLEHRSHPYFPELGAHGEWHAREYYFTEGLRRATFVITGTEVGRDEIVRYYNVAADRIRLLPHPTPQFAIDAARSDVALALPVPAPYVFYPAQFWSHKNHVGLLDAIAELRKRGVVVHCALVGSDKGNLEHVRARAAALGIGGQVHFLGFVERADLIALYRHATALAYTSLCGPENLPPLEAMALGCPVIASDIPGAREQLGDAAVLVDTLDAGALADAIDRVLSTSELRTRLIDDGRTRAARYTQVEFRNDLQALVDEFRRRRELWGS